MPSIIQGSMPPIVGLKWGTIDIQQVMFGTIPVWQRATLRDDFSDNSVTGLGPFWTDYGPAVDPYRAQVTSGGYARCAMPDTGLISPAVNTQTSRWRYNAAVTPNDDSYLEVKLTAMGSWRSNYKSRAYIRGSNTAFTDGVGMCISATGEVQISRLVASSETLTSVLGTAKSGDVLRMIPAGRTFTIWKNGRFLGTWTDTAAATQLGGGYRSVLVSFMASKDGPIGVRQFSPGFDYVEAGGGVNGITITSLKQYTRVERNSLPVNTVPGYVAQSGDLVLIVAALSTGNKTYSDASITAAGFSNLLGPAGTIVTAGGKTMHAFYHVVTDAEALAGTTSWTLNSLWTGTSYAGVECLVLRGANPADPVDAVATGSSGSTSPHILPDLPGASLNNRSLVLGFLGNGNSQGYSSVPPTDWTLLNTYSNTFSTPPTAVYQRNALTQAGVNVASASVTPKASGAYVACTVAVNVKPNT